jgi:antitoxin ParD1/3/4
VQQGAGATLILFLTNFAKSCKLPQNWAMSTMNISLPATLRSFVDDQVRERGYGTSSEYVRELIREDQDRQMLRVLLVDGATSPVGMLADSAYFTDLRKRIQRAT